MVWAHWVLAVITLIWVVNGGIFDQDLRNAGQHSVERFERVSAARVAEVRDIVKQLGDIYRDSMNDLGAISGRVDRIVDRLSKLLMGVPFTIFGYLLLYFHMDKIGPWKALGMGIVIPFVGVVILE